MFFIFTTGLVRAGEVTTFIFHPTRLLPAPSINITPWIQLNKTFNDNFNDNFGRNWAIIAMINNWNSSFDTFYGNLSYLQNNGIPFIVQSHGPDEKNKCSWGSNSSVGMCMNETWISNISSSFSMFKGVRFHEVGAENLESSQDSSFITWLIQNNITTYVNDAGYGHWNMMNETIYSVMFNRSINNGTVIPLWETNHPYSNNGGHGDNSLARGITMGFWLNNQTDYYGVSLQDWYWTNPGYYKINPDYVSSTIPDFAIANSLWQNYFSGVTTYQFESERIISDTNGNLTTQGQYIANWWKTLNKSSLKQPTKTEIMNSSKIAIVIPNERIFPDWSSFLETSYENVSDYAFYSPDNPDQMQDLISSYNIPVFFGEHLNQSANPTSLSILRNFSLVILMNSQATPSSSELTIRQNLMADISSYADIFVPSKVYTWLNLTSPITPSIIGANYSNSSVTNRMINISDTMAFNNTTKHSFTGTYSPNYNSTFSYSVQSLAGVLRNRNSTLVELLNETDTTYNKGNWTSIWSFNNSYNHEVIYTTITWDWFGFDELFSDMLKYFFRNLYLHYHPENNTAFITDYNNYTAIIYPYEGNSTTYLPSNNTFNISMNGYTDLWIWSFNGSSSIAKTLNRSINPVSITENLTIGTSKIYFKFNFSSFNLTEGSLTKLYGTSNNLIDDQVPVMIKNATSSTVFINSTQNYTNINFKVNVTSLSDSRNVRWFYKAKNDNAILIPTTNISYQGGMVFDLKGVNISQSTDSNEIYSGSPYWFNNISSTPLTYSSTLSHFNITWNDTSGYSIDTVFIETNYSGTPANYTMVLINPYINTTEKKGVYNYNITLPAGTFYWKSYANSSDGFWNSTPQWTYTVAINTSTINLINLTINGTESNKAYTYPAVTNVTAWDSITDNQNITLWRNTTFIGNSTEAITDLAQLAAGFYNYTLRYPGSQNYSSATKQFNLTINTAPTLVRLYLNDSDSDISFGNNNTLNITAVINITGKTVYLDLNATGYGNNFASSATTVTNISNTTILGIGLYNATAHFDGDANYSVSSSTHFLTIIDATSPQYSNIKEYPTDPTTYAKDKQYQFNITWTDDISINEVILEFNSINYSYLSSQISRNGNEYYKTFNDLSANSSGYLYRWHANDTSNNWQSTTQQSYTINKTSPSLSLIISPNNSTTYGTTTVANGTLITGDSNANISLYRNGTIVNSSTTLLSIIETILLGGGAYNYTFAYNGTQNYTSAAVTNITVVSQNSSLAIRLYLDRTEGNRTYTRGNTANITATANVTGKNITIEANFTGSTAAVANGTNNVTNITDTSSLLGTYNITAYFAGDSNYTTNSTTYYLTAQTLASGSSCTSSINCAGGYCVHGICRSSSTYSGDGYCDIGETCYSSPNDCGLCGGPAISITTEKEKSIITISYISSTSPKTVNTTDMNTDVTSIFISTKEAVSSVKITLEKLLSLPTNIQPLPNAYSYINITSDKIQDKNVKQAKIAFKVPRAWIINNSINESTIALFRYDSQWNKLNTAKLSEDYTSISFEAETPGFSIFAISGEKISVEASPEEEMPTPTVEMPEEEIKIKPWYEIFYKWYTWVIVGIVVLIAVVVWWVLK